MRLHDLEWPTHPRLLAPVRVRILSKIGERHLYFPLLSKVIKLEVALVQRVQWAAVRTHPRRVRRALSLRCRAHLRSMHGLEPRNPGGALTPLRHKMLLHELVLQLQHLSPANLGGLRLRRLSRYRERMPVLRQRQPTLCCLGNLRGAQPPLVDPNSSKGRLRCLIHVVCYSMHRGLAAAGDQLGGVHVVVSVTVFVGLGSTRAVCSLLSREGELLNVGDAGFPQDALPHGYGVAPLRPAMAHEPHVMPIAHPLREARDLLLPRCRRRFTAVRVACPHRQALLVAGVPPLRRRLRRAALLLEEHVARAADVPPVRLDTSIAPHREGITTRRGAIHQLVAWHRGLRIAVPDGDAPRRRPHLRRLRHHDVDHVLAARLIAAPQDPLCCVERGGVVPDVRRFSHLIPQLVREGIPAREAHRAQTHIRAALSHRVCTHDFMRVKGLIPRTPH